MAQPHNAGGIMQIGDLVKIIGYTVDLSDIGVIIDYRLAEKNRVRVIYYNILMSDRSTIWFPPEDLEGIEK